MDNALNTFVTLLLSIPQVYLLLVTNRLFLYYVEYKVLIYHIPQTDLLDYPKLSQTYYVLLECLAQDHMAFLATLEPQVTGSRIHKIILTSSADAGVAVAAAVAKIAH